MKRFLFLLVCICIVQFTEAMAASHDSSVHTPGPSYPLDALKAKVTGSGKCEVEFDASGNVAHAAMTPGTGSKVLDDNTLNFVRKNWTGHPDTKLVVPIAYELAPPAKNPKGADVHVPFAPYPYQARANHLEGRGTAKVTFDETGKAVSVVMVKSTGSNILDENTIAFGLANWRSLRGKMTCFVPVAYLLR